MLWLVLVWISSLGQQNESVSGCAVAFSGNAGPHISGTRGTVVGISYVILNKSTNFTTESTLLDTRLRLSGSDGNKAFTQLNSRIYRIIASK